MLQIKISWFKIARLALLAGLALTSVTTLTARADSGAQGFAAKGNLQPGWVVALDPNSSQTVEAAPANDTSKIYGVVIDPSDAPFVLNSQNNQVFVATSGTYKVLVSAQNGNIKPGDYLSLSSINGIAAKATSGQTTVLGQAQTGFDGHSGVITGSGSTAIGQVTANIAIQKNPLKAEAAPVPQFLKRAGDAIAGKPVAAARLYIALAVFVVGALAAVTVLWAGVRSGLVALGRNPFSRQTIFGGMYKVIFTGLGIFILGLAGVYLLLKV